MEVQKSPGFWLFAFFATTLFILESLLTIDFSQNVIITFFQIDLFLVLICWYLILGIFAPKIRKELSESSDRENSEILELKENNEGFFPIWIQFGLPIIVLSELILVRWLINGNISVNHIIGLSLYVLGPLFILKIKHWIGMFITVLWIWFPIEWNVINNILGDLELTLIPLDALIGLFSILWPLIVFGRHIPWYSWSISRSDLILVGKVSGVLTLAIVPLGILTRFITINPDNFLDPEVKIGSNVILNSIFFIILIFYLIFLVQGIMEETLFRDLIFKHQAVWLQDNQNKKFVANLDFGQIMIIFAGILVASIPFWDNILMFFASFIPFLDPVVETVGNIALPLGEYEGRSITFIESYPLWPFYLLVAVLLVLFSLFIYSKSNDPIVAALLVSSIIFGFAHFQDFRYVFFASIAGYGYGYTYYKTKNIIPSAMVHMGVDAIWVLLLTF